MSTVAIDLQATIDAAPAWSEVVIPPGLHVVSQPLTLRRPIRLSGFGAVLSLAAAMPSLLIVASNWVTLSGLLLKGLQFVTRRDEDGIRVIGTSAQSPITNFTLDSCEVESFGGNGLLMRYVTGFNLLGNSIHDCFYSGIQAQSCTYGEIRRNTVANIVGSPNAYGITLTRQTGNPGELTTDPHSGYVRVLDNDLSDVPNWSGLDAHAGHDFLFEANSIMRCKLPISVGACKDSTGTYKYAPHRVEVLGNSMDSESVGQNGIVLTGCANSLGDPTEDRATECVIDGNTIHRCGNPANPRVGGIHVYGTSGLLIQGNNIVEPSPHGIVLYHDNFDVAVEDNTITDPWRPLAGGLNDALGIYGADKYNTGRAVGNRLVRGLKVAPLVGSKLIHVLSHPTNNVVVA